MKHKLIAVLTIAIIAMSTFAIIGSVSAKNYNCGAVYTIDNDPTENHVLYYSRAWDGSLTYEASYETRGEGTGSIFHSQGALVLTENGRYLLVVNAGSNDISVFKVQKNGLEYLRTTDSKGTMPVSLTAKGNLVYVLNAGGSGNIAGFKLRRTGELEYISGSIQPLSDSTFVDPTQIGFSPDGKILVVTELATNLIDVYRVNWHGVASEPISQMSAGDAPFGFAFTKKGIFWWSLTTLVVSEASGSTSSYAVFKNGILKTISGAIPSNTGSPCWVAINDRGTFAYTGNGGAGTISSYRISLSGQLSLKSSAAATVPAPALDLDFSKNSGFLYALSSDGGQTITGFKVLWNGNLQQVTSISSADLVNSVGIAAS
jgi:6-phosphogluconolactonase